MIEKYYTMNVSRRLSQLVADWINEHCGSTIARSTNTYRVQISIGEVSKKIDIATIFPFIMRVPFTALTIGDLDEAAAADEKRQKVHHIETVRRVMRHTRPSIRFALRSKQERIALAKIHVLCHIGLAAQFGQRFIPSPRDMGLQTQLIGLNAGLKALEGWVKIEPSLQELLAQMAIERGHLRASRSFSRAAEKMSEKARRYREESISFSPQRSLHTA